jgi:hypothetical protein
MIFLSNFKNKKYPLLIYIIVCVKKKLHHRIFIWLYLMRENTVIVVRFVTIIFYYRIGEYHKNVTTLKIKVESILIFYFILFLYI